MNSVWTELSRETQDEIILRYDQGETTIALASEFNLLSQSLDRKMRALKQNGLYYHIIRKNKGKHEKVKSSPYVASKSINPFLKVVESQKSYKAQGAIDFKFINEKAEPKHRAMLIDSRKQWSGIFFTDIHCPFQDDESINAMIRVLEVMDYNIIVNGGDNLDLYGLSVYAKDPDMVFQNHFQREVDAHNVIMDRIGEAARDVPKISLYGNHMERYDKWINNTPFLSMGYLKNQLSLDSILSMSHYGWMPFQGSIMFTEEMNNLYSPKPKMVLEHGTRVSRGAGKSAASQFRSYGATSYIMGHVHRLSVAYNRTLHGQHCMAEGGTLRTLNPEYMKYPDWQSGMLHFTIDGDVVSITPILIQNGIAYVGNSKI